MKKSRILAICMTALIVCGMICSFFICPLPDFSVTVDGFAEHKIIGGRFMIITPLKADYSYVNNDRLFPRFRYISVFERKCINNRLEYFKKNVEKNNYYLELPDCRALLFI